MGSLGRVRARVRAPCCHCPFLHLPLPAITAPATGLLELSHRNSPSHRRCQPPAVVASFGLSRSRLPLRTQHREPWSGFDCRQTLLPPPLESPSRPWSFRWPALGFTVLGFGCGCGCGGRTKEKRREGEAECRDLFLGSQPKMSPSPLYVLFYFFSLPWYN